MCEYREISSSCRFIIRLEAKDEERMSSEVGRPKVALLVSCNGLGFVHRLVSHLPFTPAA